MKKSFVFAVVAAVALASCTNDESSIKMTDKLGQSEVAIYPFSKTATRGFVTGNEFFEWNFENLRDGQRELGTPDGGTTIYEKGVVKPSIMDETDNNAREMRLSVYNVDGRCDLFIDKTFTKGGSIQSGDNDPITDPYVVDFSDDYDGENEHKAYNKDSIWHANPPIYYPIGYGQFNFLAYSLGKGKELSATWNGAQEVTLEVTKDFLTDDILYGGGVQNAKAHAAAAMLFGHAQAWLTTRFTVDAGSPENVLQINKVTWQDVYASGELNIKFNNSTSDYKVDATWKFFTQEPSNVEMPDRSTDENKTYGAYVGCARKYKKDGSGYSLNGNGKRQPVTEGDQYKTDNLTMQNYLDMLIPAQPKKPFVIEYTLGGQTYEYTVKTEDLTTEKDWKMGTHYIYNIEFSITEITTAPTVRIWTEKVVKFGETSETETPSSPLEL